MTQTTDSHDMQTIDGRSRCVYTSGVDGTQYYIVDGERIYLTEESDSCLVCHDCGNLVEPAEDRRGCGAHCPECNATL